MNFLAHLYLSKNNKNVLIGNFISDAIKGKDYKRYPHEIKAGILLHREIDTFTDTHPTVRKSMHRLHKRYGHYDGVIIDLLYDHFLAKNWANYSAIPLADFAQDFYNLLNDNFEILPKKTQHLLPYMIEYNWLYNYQFFEGIEKVLNGMNNRTKQKSQMHLAIEDLKSLHSEFEEDFTVFFEDLRNFSNQKLKELNQT